MKKIGCLLLAFLLAAGMTIGVLKWGGKDLTAWGRTGDGTIHVQAEGRPDAAMLRDVEKAAAAFNDQLQAGMGVRLTRDVEVYVAGSEADYQQVLEREFDLEPAEAKSIADISGGWTGGKRAVTAINGKAGVMTGPSDRISTTAHELFHQVQYELSDGNDTDEKALFWLEEGSADYIGARIAESLGGKTMTKWILDVKVELMRAPKTASPQELQHNTLRQRKDLMCKDLHTYQMADLMTWYLLTRYAKGEEEIKLADYFRKLREIHQGENAFAQTFGIELADFLQEFSQWWAAEQQKTAALHFEAREGVDKGLVDSLQRQAEAAQDLFARRLGRQLRGEYQLVLSPSQQDMAQAVALYCDLPAEKAAEIAAASLWIENGSTILINAQQLESDRQRIFTMGALLMRVMQGQRMGAPERNIEWLVRGAGYIMGVARLGEAGLGTLPQYQHAWIASLREKGVIPQLAQMETPDGYRQVADSFTDDTASVLTEYATAELVTRYGWKSLSDWQEAVRSTGDGQKAFRQVFGLNLVDFEAAVQGKVQRQVKSHR
ncbi:hypothetical protein SAMN02910356_02394 [Selenomonas sp. GACV-9]|uniref:hypothetical protein n=1 Tax=Selenomonas sp. GACV-9 TaxID=3158782 RepID=UPI0008E5D0DC|nr:hypothetical protein SAMN02910356_02394 [Selenomonas ruminantium]